MECRPDCGAYCTAPSISGPIPGMPDGKPINTPRVQLDESLRCKVSAPSLRPKVCGGLQPSAEMCRRTTHQIIVYPIELEALAAP